MVKFEPIKKMPGELIKSEDWNKIQEDVQEDLTKMEQELQILRDYINNMAKSVTLINMDSPTGKSYRLDEELPGEVARWGCGSPTPATPPSSAPTAVPSWT